MSQTQQQLNLKEAERKEAAAEAMKTRCVTCFRETAPKRICGGHGGGGGGGGESGGAGSESDAGQDYDHSGGGTSDEVDEDTEVLLSESSLVAGEEEVDLESQEESNRFDPQVIAKMVESGLLEVINDRKSNTLSINLLADPKTLSEKQRQEFSRYLNAILEELKTFMRENNLSDDCLNIVEDEMGNIKSFTFKAPTLALYDAFIEQLAIHLAPIADTKIEAEDEQLEIFNPSPFSMKMKPW